MNINVIAVIPARYQAVRFPGKLLKDLNGKSVILSTYLAAESTGLFDEVIVAADDQRIIDEIISNGGIAIMTSPNHQSGSDRIAEVIQNKKMDIVINIQGDEPFIQKSDLSKLIDIFKNDLDQKIHVATLAELITDRNEIINPNNVKVVCNADDNALYFSRSPIPWKRDEQEKIPYLKHIGIYAYRKQALLEFTLLPQGKLEEIEKLEQLRYLENGYTIQVAIADNSTIGIDTEEDLINARKFSQKQLNN